MASRPGRHESGRLRHRLFRPVPAIGAGRPRRAADVVAPRAHRRSARIRSSRRGGPVGMTAAAIFNEGLADQILYAVADGASLLEACETAGVSRRTVRSWIDR